MSKHRRLCCNVRSSGPAKVRRRLAIEPEEGSLGSREAPPAARLEKSSTRDVLAIRIGELRERLAGVRLRMRLAEIEEAGLVAALKAAEGHEVR